MAHTEGNTPGRTAETRTKSAHFLHPQDEGQVHYGDESWPIVAGVVECLLEVGEGAQWPRADPDAIARHKKAIDGPTADELRAELLRGSVADIEEALATEDRVEELAALEELEGAGKARKGVLGAIHARLDVLTKPPVTP